MGSKQKTKVYPPMFPSETASLRAIARGILGEAGTPSPYYSDLRRMWEETTRERFEVPEYLTRTLEEAVTTGLPSLTPLTETPYYKATYPAFQRGIEETVLPAVKETFGARGALRTSDYAKAATEAAASALEDYVLSSAARAYAMEEAAKQRQLSAIPLELQALGAPFDWLSQLTQAAAAAEALKYPLLPYLIQAAYAGVGRPDVVVKESPWPGLAKSGIEATGAVLAAVLPKIIPFVCWLVNELYKNEPYKAYYLRFRVNFGWPKTFIGRIKKKLYVGYGEKIAKFIRRKNIISIVVRKCLKLYFDYEFKKMEEVSYACLLC